MAEWVPMENCPGYSCMGGSDETEHFEDVTVRTLRS